MRYLVPLAIVGLLGACEAPVSSPELHPSLQTPHAWSRGEVRISDPVFASSAALPTVTVGSHTLVVRAVDDTTIAATLPDTSGPVALSVHAFGAVVPAGPVIVAGFREAYDGPFLSGYVLPWPSDNPTSVLGAGDSGAVLVDLRFNHIARAFPESLHSPDCAWGVGQSAFSGHAVFYGRRPGGGCARAVSYQLGPSVVAGDTLLGFPGTWVLGELGSRRSVTSSDSWLYLMNCDTTPCQFQEYFGGGAVTGLTLSPRGDRVVFDNGGGRPPIVIDPRNLTTAFVLPLLYTNGSAFSPGGDTLWVVGTDALYPQRIVAALDATTGGVLATAVLDSLITDRWEVLKAVAIDPEGPWLYVSLSATVSSGAHTLLVLDRQSLALRGVLVAPREDRQSWDFERIIPMPAGDVIFLVTTAQGYDLRGRRARIFRFDRLPS